MAFQVICENIFVLSSFGAGLRCNYSFWWLLINRFRINGTRGLKTKAGIWISDLEKGLTFAYDMNTISSTKYAIERLKRGKMQCLCLTSNKPAKDTR
jgi:hypothetical protein